MKNRRISKLISAILMILASIVIILDNEFGYYLLMILLTFKLLATGISNLIYYFTMARYKVGGISIFYKGILYFDAGLLALTLETIPQSYGMIYLASLIIYSGATDILQANSGRKLGAGHWHYQMFYGVTEIAIALVGLLYMNSLKMLSFILCIYLIHSAIFRIVSAFRRTAVIYVA